MAAKVILGIIGGILLICCLCICCMLTLISHPSFRDNYCNELNREGVGRAGDILRLCN